MMAFMQYAMQIVFAFLMLSMMFIILPRAAVSGDRIADVLETEPSIKIQSTPGSSRRRSRARSSSGMSISATPVQKRMSCTTSASPPSQGRPRPSSAPPAPANRPLSA